jgi:hypothetical protein
MAEVIGFENCTTQKGKRRLKMINKLSPQKQQDYFRRLDMKAAMHGALAKAIRAMVDAGASPQDIADTLRFAADEIIADADEMV